VTATRYAAEAYASFLSQRWFVVWLYSIEVWSAGGCKTETDLPWRRWCVVESCSGVRELRPLAFCTRQTMKLIKGNLTSRFAHSARLHKERPSLKVKGITTSVVRMCCDLCRRPDYQSEFSSRRALCWLTTSWAASEKVDEVSSGGRPQKVKARWPEHGAQL